MIDCIYSWIACLAFMFECGIMVLRLNGLHVYSALRVYVNWLDVMNVGFLICCSEMMATLQWTKGTLFIWYNSWSCYCLVILNIQLSLFLIQELLFFFYFLVDIKNMPAAPVYFCSRQKCNWSDFCCCFVYWLYD